MIKNLLARMFGTRQAREVRRVMPVVHQIHEHEARLRNIGEDELKGQTAKLRARIAEQTGALKQQLEDVRRAKHDCEDPVERTQLEERTGSLEVEYKKALAAVLNELL